MKLAAKIMLMFLAVVMLMTAAGSYFSVRRGFERFEEQQQQFARDTADAIEDQLADAWRRGGANGLLDAMRSLSVPDPRHKAQWIWLEQTRISDGTGVQIIERRAGIGGDMESRTITDERGERHLRTFYPIDLGDSPRGGLEVTGSLEPLDNAARETVVTALATIGLMAIVSLALAYAAGMRWVARPLQRLIDKTERIGSGDFSDPLPTRGNDELSELARALNKMSDQLAAQQEKIRDEAAARQATLEQLRHADRLKTVGRLAAGLAHELGTPLNVVSGRAGLIASGQLTEEEVAASARTIKSEAERVTGIIRQLLDFARPARSQREAVDMTRLLEETAGLLEPLAEKVGVRIETRLAPQLFVRADRSQLLQVFTNIVVNAIQAMPTGGVVTVATEACEAPPPDQDTGETRPYLVSRICDQGVGISPEHLEQLFEPFFTTKDVGEGTGLGLSIAYGIVREHGGWIAVDSRPEEGSCFSVYLPLE
ncbi:MAG: HAMP domain-containing protein [Planctomycetales bacterium]|nr:HAMP domain-containing protein [Planctomycetales bacterium]